MALASAHEALISTQTVKVTAPFLASQPGHSTNKKPRTGRGFLKTFTETSLLPTPARSLRLAPLP
jgi:hypothetical protein